jgi:hypothetical protein
MIDLGPCGFFDQELVLLVSALNVLKSKGVDEETLNSILDEVKMFSYRYKTKSPLRLARLEAGKTLELTESSPSRMTQLISQTLSSSMQEVAMPTF